MSYFDSLPDGVVCLIFSKLEWAQAVARCSAVCQRWHGLCRVVDTLTFESFQLFENREEKRRASYIQDVVSSMLLRTSGVKNLKIAYHPVVWPWIPLDHFSEDKVCAWLQHVNGSLEQLTLVDPVRKMQQPNRLIFLSGCRKLHWLNLCYAYIPLIPPQCHPFEVLKSCFLDLIVISDTALSTLVELCPLLEYLRLDSCIGLKTPLLRAPNLRSLGFMNYLGCVEPIQRVCAYTPKLENVFLSCVEELTTEGEALSELELRCHVKPHIHLLPSLSSLSMHGPVWQLESILEYVRLGTSAKWLYIGVQLEEKKPLLMDSLLGQLQNLNSLYIGSDFFECLQAGAKSVPTAQRMSLPLLENVTTVVRSGNEHCISVLKAFLKCCGSLKKLCIDADPLKNGSENMTFFTSVLALQRAYPHVEIVLGCPSSLR